MSKMQYRAGYKYQLAEDYSTSVDIFPEEKIELKYIELTKEGLLAAITAILGLYKFQENWLEFRTTCESLKHEKYLFLTKSEPYDQEESFRLLVDRVESLISKENTAWNRCMKKEKKK